MIRPRWLILLIAVLFLWAALGAPALAGSEEEEDEEVQTGAGGPADSGPTTGDTGGGPVDSGPTTGDTGGGPADSGPTTGDTGTTTPTIQGNQATARPLFQRGEQAFRQGQYAQAAQLFQQAYDAWRHPAFQYNKGQALLRARDGGGALAAFQLYVSTYRSSGLPPDRFESLVHIRIAECQHRLNRRDQATAALRRYLELNPQGDLAPAVRQCVDRNQDPSTIGARDPQTVQAARRIHDEAAALEGQGRHRQAAERFIQGYNQYNEITEFLYNAATSYRAGRMWVEAIREYERYVQTACPAAEAYVELAQCYHERAEYQRAVDTYRRYLQREPRGASAQTAREYIQSMTAVLAMRSQPPSREAMGRAGQHFDRGATHYNAGRYRQALQEFTQANDLIPTRQARYNIGMCYYRMRNWASTLSTFENYLRDGDDAEHAVAHLYAAESLLEIERWADAQRHIRDYLARADAAELPNEQRDRATAQRLLQRVRQASGAGGST